VFFSLLEGHLFSDGIGLASHMFLRFLVGIYGRSRGSGGIQRVCVIAGLDGYLMADMKISSMF
jgi:hypothetical protein